MVLGFWRKDLFEELLGSDGVLTGVFELVVLISFCYLYFAFRGKFKIVNVPVYKFLSLGFGFTALSILLPMLAIFMGTALLGDSIEEQIFIINDVPYYICSALSILFFIVAARKAELKPSNK